MLRARSIFNAYRLPLLFGVVIACLLFVVAVFATSEERTIHILPVTVESERWMKDTQALEQTLGTQAIFSDFNRDNSAFVIEIDNEPALEEASSSAPMQGEWGADQTNDGVTDGEVPALPGDGEILESPTPLPDVTMMEYLYSLARASGISVAQAQESASTPAEEEPSLSVETVSEPVAEPTESQDVVNSSDSINEALDTTSSENISEPEPNLDTDTIQPKEEDVRLCTVLGTTCHTIRFNGFDIGSVLSDHTVTGYTLRMSLAARPLGESFTPDKLVVRYQYRDTWHLAGEVTIDHELSNVTTGGHLAFSLPNLEGWDALKDFAVEVEYVRQGTGRTEVFLDSVWIDTTYEVNTADEPAPEARNILTELAVLEDSGRPDLLIADDKRIELTETDDDSGEDLVVRSDADVYSGLTTARAYVAVTNRGDAEHSFRLRTHIGKQATVDRVLERVNNVPETDATPEYSEVAYFCDAGWELANDVVEESTPIEPSAEENIQTGDVASGDTESTDTTTTSDSTTITNLDDSEMNSIASTTDEVTTVVEDANEVIAENVEETPVVLSSTYVCKATHDTETCNSFNADKTNCIVGNERISVSDSVRYVGSWNTLSLVDGAQNAGGRSVLQRLFNAEEVPIAPQLERISEVDQDFTIVPGETRYFAADLSFPIQRAGEFLVEVVDDGDISTVRNAWWRSAFKYRIPITWMSINNEESSEVPSLSEFSFDYTHADVFERAALDGSDVRFYDPIEHKEIPAKELEYTYVDQRAQYALDLGETPHDATTTLYAYFGNEHVFADDRLPAPRSTELPIEYVGVKVPRDGAVISVTSGRDDVSVLPPQTEEPLSLPYGHTRSIFLSNTEDRLFSNAPISVALNESEHGAGVRDFSLALPSDTHVTETELPDGRTEYLLERFMLNTVEPTFGVIEELPLPAVDAFEPIYQNKADRINYLRALRGPQLHQFLESLRDFELGDRPEFMMKYQAQKGAVSRFFRGLFRDKLATVSSVRLMHNGVPVEDARFEVIYGLEGEWTLRMIEMPRTIVPGLYTLELVIDEVGTVFTDSFDFYWGVLAVNTPQSIYLPNDLVDFHMAALDDKGDTICDADLRLTVTDPSGNAEEIGVEPQGTCGPNNVTDKPDYLAWYRPKDVGTYTLQLTHLNLNGDAVHQVFDSFEVRESSPFTIRRSGATRIWPKASYVMELELTTENDFKGTFVEAVPENFVLIDTGGAETEVWGGAKRLAWDVELDAGETATFSYEYDAPDVSPYLYLIGPAEVRSGDGLPFTELRQWKLASDAVGSYVELNQALSVANASTWETIDLSGYGVPADAVVEIAIKSSRTSNGTRVGGARAATSTLTRSFTIPRVSGGGVNELTLTVQSSATSSIQLYGSSITEVTFTLLGYWTAGTYTEQMQQIDPGITNATWGAISLSSYGPSHGSVVEMVVGNWDTGADSSAGIRSSSSTLDRRITISRPRTGGVRTATLLATASGTNAVIDGYAQVEGANNASIDYWLVGYWSSTTVPTGLRYVDRLDTVTVPGSATTWTDVALDSFGLGKNTVAEFLVANSGTANTSLDLGVRANGSALARTFTLGQALTAGWNPSRMHAVPDNSGSSTIENYVSATANANFSMIGYWRPSDYYPEAPTLYDTPFNSEKTGSTSPYFEFSATDPDGTSDLVYEFEYDDDADLDTSPLGDRTSDNETGCSPNCFTNTVSGGDTSPFTEGNRIRFSLQSTLITGTTYYWRVRAKDTSGSNSFGDWSSVQSFTYVSGTDPKAWHQTEDSQFDDGTLSGAETYGSNQVRIATTPPTGAMVAFGEGTRQTPAYRTWDGSSWSATSTAQSVGGQISWTVLKAAPTRNEYVLGTQDLSSDVNVQVYNGTAGTWGNLTELNPNLASIDRRGFDIAYQSQSGNAVAVFCYNNGTNYEASYSVWNGTSWSATSTIDLQFNANCNWIKLAASPSSDEITLVAQADSTNTTSDFEAQVYSNGAWGNSYTAGANTAGEEFFERMAVGYEDSGNEAVMVVGNGGTANFISATWNSSSQTWTANANRTTQDDFEWGELTADDGTDSLGLCYIDEDNQAHIAKWDGSANTWDTYDAAGDQIDTATLGVAGGTDYHARGVTCQYEITAGRDGYLMVPYTDATNARYRVWNGSTLPAEISVSTIEDSWTVGSARTGDGKILTVFRDNTNARYDFSYWNGSSWSARQTLGSVVSDTVESYGEAIAVVAARYQQSSGSIVSPIVDFDLVPGQASWGEVLWTTTEPSNTDVVLRVYYATTTATCNVLVPDAALAGNSTGFTSTSSPLNISSLSTSTYNMLCIKASLTSDSTESPTLNDWTVSWERQPYLTQTHFRWYANTNGTTPSDVWPAGTNAIFEDEAIPASYAPSTGDVLRLRVALQDSNVTLPSSSSAFKLQWAEGQTCSASLDWGDVGSISSSEVWRGYNNASPSDGATLPSRVLSTTDVSFSYEEENNTATNTSALTSGQEAELDFVLYHSATSSTYYCFRLMNADGTVLNAYDRYPQLITNAPPSTPTLQTPFTFESLASTSPYFTFVAEDGKGDDIHYEVEVDDDIAFGSPTLDRNSQDNFDEFSNTITTADKSPFYSGQAVRFIPTSALSNGTTYWWRVRARDPNGSNDWSSWSDPQSFTVNTSVTISTWYQTTLDQFSQDDTELTEATSTNDIVLTPPNTAGTSTSPGIEFGWHTTGNAWGALSWTDNETTGDIRYHIEYYTAGTWALIPDSALSGNAAGYGTGAPISLLGLDPTVYDTIRIRANFTYIGGTPRLNDWTLSWGLAVSQPTLLTLFDNEKTGTTTPSFTFYSTDPQSDDLQYEFQWSTSSAFTRSTTSTSSATNTAFRNTASTTDTSPFVAGNTIQFTATSGSMFVNGGTYWWRVRARDPSGGNTWSVWSPIRSFTVDTTVGVSTWYQTTDNQFDTDTLTNTETYGSNQLHITSTIREALIAYAEGVIQTPRYRLWTGTAWGTERSAENIGERIYWIRTKAAPTRNEYVMATEGLSGAVKAQIYDRDAETWSDLTTLSVPAAPTRRGFDVAYETSSGDAIVVSCYGADATYRVWNGTSWTASSTINLGFTQNCEWIELASDPTSDEIVMSARANTTNTPYAFEAQVWSGSSWGNSTTQGLMEAADAENIGMDVEYEESGGDAVLVTSNGTNANFHYRSWNGASWTASSSVVTTDDLETPKIRRDLGSDNMVMCFVAQNNGIYYSTWNGSAFAAPVNISADSNSKDGGHSFDCEFETTSGRDGYLFFPYTDAVNDFYRYYDGATLQPETASALATVLGSWSVHTARTGDGNILTAYWDDANTQFDFSYWNGSAWSTAQTLETNVSTIVNPISPIDMTPRRYTSFTSGSIVSDAITFSSGSGPRWGYASSTDTTPGSSYILYQLEYSADSGDTWSLIPDDVLPGNSVGTTSNSVDLSNIPYSTYGTIRYVANFVCVSGDCPILNDWTISWSEGITVSGTAQQYNRSSNVTSGTVAVAVNGVLQSGKTGTISGGSWSILNVTAFPGDTITVFIDGAADSNEATAVTKYDGLGNITNVRLYERHLTLGSDDATTTTNAMIAMYDYSTSSDEDVFFDVDSGNDLYVCAPASGTCSDAVLYVASGYTYRADQSNSGTLYAHDVVTNGTTTADSNTFYVSGSWDNNGLFSGAGSTLVFTATSGSETVDNVGSATTSYNNVTFGQGSGTTTWTNTGNFDVNGTLAITYGTFSASTSNLYLSGNVTIGANGGFTKGTGTTTFDGSSVSILTDSTVVKQDLGKVAVDGSSKTVRLATAARITDLTIATANTFDVTSSNYALEIIGDFRNSGSFSAQSGTVTFTATSTGHVIDPGSSSLYNVTMNGVGGNWAFLPSSVTIGNNLTIATGTLTLTSGTTTISGSVTNSGGVFVHNNGTVELAGSGTKTLYQNNSPFFNLTVNGSGSWSWTDTNATSSGSVRVTNGTLTFPSGTQTIGKSLVNSGGTLRSNNGTLRFTSATTETIQANNAVLYNLTVAGTGGTFTLADTNLTASGTVAFVAGTTTLPSGVFSVAGSYVATGGTFTATSGTVRFIATTTGYTVTPGTSSFNSVTFDGTTGGWTVTSSATSSGAWNITNASSLTVQSGATIEVRGTFSNTAPSATTWTGSTLYLNSGTAYTIGSKTQTSEGYGTLRVGANTDIRMWQSSSTVYTVDSTGSLYSQDHAGTDGDLYVWGEYTRTSGTDYWSYATDFDGTALGGGSRQVDVRFASGASARFTGSTVQIVGGSSASTTLANQGSGSYALTVTGGTVNAQYYSVTNTDSAGFSILGSSTVTSLSYGEYTLSTNGGTMLTVSSSTIDTNLVLQPMRVSFATSSGITSGYNVTASGTPTSYWWFKESYGNYDGENFDNDPVAGPGAIRWDDSGYTISISGTVYAGEGSGGTPTACNSLTNNVRLVVNGTTPYAVPCTSGTGTFTFPAVTYTGDVTLVAYLDGITGTRGATVSRTPIGNITGFDVYQNRVVVRHEDTTPLTIAQMLAYDSDQDTDIPFDAESGSLTVQPEFALFVWTGKTFAPGGNVTLNSGGSGAVYDGSLRLDDNAVFTSAGTESHSVGGSWTADTGSTFTPASSTVTFTATTSGKTITPNSPFADVIFSGSGGAWTLGGPMTTNGSTTVNAGTLSGTSNLTVRAGALSGNGTISMTGGTVSVERGGLFGGSSAWTFSSLTLGDGASGVTTKSGAGGVSVTNILTVSANHQLRAGSATWTLSGTGAVFPVSGTFTAETSTTTFAGTSAMTVPALTYNNLVLAPSGGGSPTYTLSAGSLGATTVTAGNGTNAVTVNADTNDPLITVSDDVTIRSSATLSASNANDLLIAGSYTNQGTYTSNGGGVVFNSSDTGETVTPGSSSFHHITFSGAGGGWTMVGNATSTGNFSLTTASSYTQTSGTTLVVQGVFTNAVGGGATTWSGSTLYLNSGTSYTLNTKSAGADAYGTLRIGANTDTRMWNSTSTVYTVDSTGSLYSQDHNSTDGALYIWGDYVRSSGSDYWSYATDFDGTNLASTSSQRPVSVYFASNATTTLSGGTLEILGGVGATTTIQRQSSGTYALRVSGGTVNAQYYKIRNIDSSGLAFSGSPTVTQLGDADLLLEINGGSTMTVASSVIDANPVKNWQRITFATSSGISTGYNVTATGVSVSSWRFIPGGGNYYGETHDNDPAGDPGYLIFSDSAADVTISGNVYSDEGITVSPICNGSTPVVRLLIEGGSPQTASCASGTGHYSISGITYSPGDTVTVYIDGTSTRAANISVDPVTSISDMHLYANRVIVRHEDTSPMTIADMAVYDSSEDSDIPFTAATGTPNTLSLPANYKLIVWTGKTFRPGGNVTLNSGGSGTTYDGTIELQTSSVLVSSSTAAETYSVGGSWLTGTGATFTSGLSNVTFTATTSGKTVSPDTSSFYQLAFNGSGGAWTFTDRDATTTDNFTVSNGSVTLGTSTLAVGGSFANSGTLSAASTSIRFTSGSAETIAFGGSSVGSLAFAGVGAHTMTDTNATTTGSVTISAGSVLLPSGTFAIANSFIASGGTFTHAGTVRLYGALAAQSITFGSSVLGNLTLAGSGSWSITDVNATTTGSTTISQGSLTGPSGSFAVGSSFTNSGTYNSNAGLLHFFATSTGKTINSGGAVLADVLFNGAGGGWTVATSATSTGSWRIRTGTSYTMATGTRLEVQGTFENIVGGSATNWTDSTLYLNASGTSYTINTKSVGGDTYANLTLGANTYIRSWDSSASTTTVPTSAYLYSMDNNATSGSLYIWGSYTRSSGADYWSYANDFDGTALGGSSRQVQVRIASSSSITYTGGSLDIIGTASATTTVAVQGTGAYAFALSGGTLNATHYSFRNLNASGLALSGSLSVTSLSYGDFELSANTGTLITVASTTIDQNPSRIITGNRFSTSTGIATGTNVIVLGTTANFWDFRSHDGNLDGESYDSDGVGTCGAARWDDSVCLELSQTHYRFRSDTGGGGAPNSEWYDTSWSKRKLVNITNPNATTLTNVAVNFDMPYDGDMLSDFTDLRFTDNSGTTSIPYWIESYTTSATATVWVKVPSISANSATYLYAYYGNASAGSGESGSSTFSFFDDFEDDNISEYSGDTSYFDALTAFNTEGSYGLGAASGFENSQTADGIYRTSTSFAQGSTIRWSQYVDATQDDEPCTLFAVQTPGSNNQNYAVCLDQYPSDKLVLAKNVSSNNGSGTTLASSTVTWTTQWYEVEVDWLTDNTIYVSVYDASGALFATTSATDSSYSSGGMGFSFWYQSGGWDAYLVRPYAQSEPTTWVGLEQGKDGASWKAAQDTAYSQAQNETFRVRFSIENTGAQITGQQWRLQYADRTGYGTCAAVPTVAYNDVPNAVGCGTSPVCMVTTSYYADGDATQQLLVSDTYLPSSQGMLVEDPSNQTSATTLNQNYMTEAEYAIELTPYATADSYCMRTSNGGIALDSYQNVAEVTAKYEPNITDWSLNLDDSIALVEGQSTTIYATGTVTDLNGWTDILYATSTYYRSGVGSQCTANDNNCYQLTSLDCPLDNCSGNSCTIECTANIQFFAEPTDSGSTYSAEDWRADVYVIDTTGNVATTTSGGVDVLTLWGLSLTTSGINYGLVPLNSDTGATTSTSTLQNTGNEAVDVNLQGTDLTSGSSTIPVGNQKYATSTFTYSSCVICSALSGTASTLQVDLPKPTSATPVTDDVYWGIYVPTGVAGTTHYGQNTFYAVSNN